MIPQSRQPKGVSQWLGYWRTDAPIDVREIDEDSPILDALIIPIGMTISRMEVWVHGRLWEWEKVEASTL